MLRFLLWTEIVFSNIHWHLLTNFLYSGHRILLVYWSYCKKSGTYPPDIYPYLNSETLIDKKGLLGEVIFRRVYHESFKNCYLLLFQHHRNISQKFFHLRTVFDLLPIQVQDFLYRSCFSSGSRPFTDNMGTFFI